MSLAVSPLAPGAPSGQSNMVSGGGEVCPGLPMKEVLRNSDPHVICVSNEKLKHETTLSVVIKLPERFWIARNDISCPLNMEKTT